MKHKLLTGLFCVLIIISLLGCTKAISEQSSSNNENQTEKNPKPTTTNKSEEKLSETIGFIQSKSSESILVAATKEELKSETKANSNDISKGIIFDISAINENIISNLSVGQRVKVKHYSNLAYSSPPQGKALEVILLEE